MKIGFDLDGTLDTPAIARLCQAMLNEGHTVYIISGVFTEAGDWQSLEAKRRKLQTLGIPHVVWPSTHDRGLAMLYVLESSPAQGDRDYRLADIGLRKGDLCQRLGIEVFVEDSELYCTMIPKMCGAVTVLHLK